MNIDTTAPLSAQATIVIAAPLGRVWEALTGIDRWPEWQADVSSARLNGNLAAGSTFRWKARGLRITSTIQELEPRRRIGWTGTSIGMSAIHIWTLGEHEGGTRVTTEESLAGWFPRILRMSSPRFLEDSLARSLQVLKDHSERQ